MRHRGRSHCVLQNQVPAHDPREQLTQRGVRIGVGRSRHGHHRSELRVTQGSEKTGQAGNDEGEHQRGAGQIVRRDARQDEDAGADDGADAEARQLDGAEDAAELIFTVEFLNERLVRLYLKQLICHMHLLAFERFKSTHSNRKESCPYDQKSPPLKRRATATCERLRNCCSPGLQTRGFAAPDRRVQAQYTGTPSSTITRPGQVSCVWYRIRISMMISAVTIYRMGTTG